MTIDTISAAFALVTPAPIDSFVDWALNRREVGPDPLGLYPLGWMTERMLPEYAQDDEAEFCRVAGTGSFADFMRNPAAVLGVVS